jgi:hypothetical protein
MGGIMKLILPVISFCLGIVTFAVPARAMDISIRKSDDGLRYVLASGPIVPGDPERLRLALQSADIDRWGNKNVALDSPGGRVVVALAMAKIMDEQNVSTIVFPGDSCASQRAPKSSSSLVTTGGSLMADNLGCILARTKIRDDLCNEEIATNATVHGMRHIEAFMKYTNPSGMVWFDRRIVGGSRYGPPNITGELNKAILHRAF